MNLLIRDKVSSPKISVELVGRLIVCLRGFYRRLEVPQIDVLPVYSNCGAVRIVSIGYVSKKNNASEPSLAVRARPLIHSVLGMGGLPHVRLPAIKTVAVDVVNIFRGEPHDQGVEGYRNSLSTALGYMSLRIENSLIFTYLKKPLEAANHVGVLVVNYCRLALGEWDYNHSPNIPNFGGL